MHDLLKNKNPGAAEIALRILISVMIILCGLAVYFGFNLAKTERKRIKPEKIPPLVDILRVSSGDHRVVVKVMGTVAPEKEIDLKALSGGEIVMVSRDFIPGGIFRKGDIILKTDPADYLIDIKRKKAALLSAKAALDIEKGHQDVAREELSLMELTSGKKITDNGLALRKPQLDQAGAKYQAALADLEAARLNHRRTIVRAPFNCMILERNINKGSIVSSQTLLGRLVGTDAYWIRASIPVDQLRWIKIPDKNDKNGSYAMIRTRYQDEFSEPHSGRVLRLTGSLNEKSRMATIIVRVFDPNILETTVKRSPLILGSYVSLDIKGRSLDNIIPIPRKALRDNDTIWIFDDGRLGIRSIKPIWKGVDTIYIAEGIEEGQAVILSALASPVEGMRLTEKGKAPALKGASGNNKKKMKI